MQSDPQIIKPARTTNRATKIAALVIGAIMLLVSFGLLVGGGALYYVNTSLTDSQGFISSTPQDFTSASYAIASQGVSMNLGMATDLGLWKTWMTDLIKVRITALSNNPSENVFIGVVKESDAQTYLNNVSYDEIVKLNINPSKTLDVQYMPHQGTAPTVPLSKTFWVLSAHGTGTQTLQWTPRNGTYRIILMNEDGSAGINHNVSLAAQIPLLSTISIALLIAGIVGLVAGSIIVYYGARR